MLPLKGCTSDGTRPSGITRSRASAPSTSMLARVVSKWLLFGTTSPGRQDRVEQDALGRAPLVRRDDVAESGEVLHDRLEAVERAAAGVRLVALHQRAPLRRRHRAGPRVREQVDEHVVAAQAGRRCRRPPPARDAASASSVKWRASTDLMRNGSMMVLNGIADARLPPAASSRRAAACGTCRGPRGRCGWRRPGP